MKILKIDTNNTKFKAKSDYYIRKEMLQNNMRTGAEPYAITRLRKEGKRVRSMVNDVVAITLTAVGVEAVLKDNDITYLELDGDKIHAVAGYNGGYYTVQPSQKLSPELLRAYFAQSLVDGNNENLGGLYNYKKMVSNLKRQDLIQRGLQLHTYELNTDIDSEQAELSANTLSKLSKRRIKPKDLFFLGTDAFYYDNFDKTAYSINAYSTSVLKKEPTYRTCKFLTDEKGNAIGYEVTAMDLFAGRPKQSVYKEQQNVTEKLPEVADIDNNKIYAESFRFGNSSIQNARVKKAIPLVLNHLIERVGISCPLSEQLQIVQVYGKDKNIVTRICYYDSSVGRSLVYNDEGKYLYQMEYNKDDFGNIKACSKY